MATIYDLKPAFQQRLRPLSDWLAAHGVTANQVTVVAALISVATGVGIVRHTDQPGFLLALPAVLFLRMALNAIDGMLAREHDMKTPLGALLNELGDIFSDSALYLPFALLPGVTPVYVVAVVWLAVVSETTGILGAVIGASRRYDGPMGKSDRAFVFSVVAVILACGVEPGVWLDLVWGILVILLAFTIVNRGREALAELA